MADYTDEELYAIAGIEPPQAQPEYTDEELFSIAGIEPPQAQQQAQPEQQRTWGDYLSSIPQQYAQGGALGFGDEAMAALAATYTAAREQPSALMGPEMRPELAQQIAQAPQMMREELKQQQEAYPVTSGLSQAGGMIATGAGAARSVPTVASGISKLPWWASAPMVGAPSYAAYEAGQATGDRAGAFVGALPEGAAYGYLGGAAGKYIPAAARGVGRYTQKAIDKFTRKPVASKTLDEAVSKEIAPAGQDVTQNALSKVKKALQKDFEQDYDLVIDEYNKGNISLADLYGERTKRLGSLAEASALFMSGREIAESALNPKALGSYDRVMKSIKENVTGVDSYYTTVDDLLMAGRAKASPIYQEIGDDLADPNVLTIPEVRGTVEKLYKENPTFFAGREPNSIYVLNEVKKNLDSKISETIRGGATYIEPQKNIVNTLIDAMENANPKYKDARAIAGDYLSVDAAIKSGKSALNLDSELVKKEFSKLSAAEKDAYKIGIGKALRDTLSSVREGANPFNRLLGSPEQKNRLKAVLTPDEYKGLEKSLRAENRLFELRNKVLGGSPTSRRDELKRVFSGGAIDTITGVPKNTFKDSLAKAGARLSQGLSDKTAAQVSDILYETDPVKKLSIINGLKNSNELTQMEKKAVQEVYSVLSPRYDALYTTTGAVSATPAMQIRGNE